MKTRKKLFGGLALVALTFSSVACKGGTQAQKQAGKDLAVEQESTSAAFNRVIKTQPVPVFDWSQVRQTLIDAETAQATGAVSTSQFVEQGVGVMYWCPSIGAPVASTTQLSATSQYVNLPNDGSNSLYPVDQGEPTGVYPGASDGTWVICLASNGKKFPVYWEGHVMTVVATISDLDPTKRLNPSDITFQVTSKG